MAWYRGYVKESRYGSPPGSRPLLRSAIQQKLPASNQPLLSRGDVQQPACPPFDEDDSFFSVRGFVTDQKGLSLVQTASPGTRKNSTGSLGSPTGTAQTTSAANAASQPQLALRPGTVNATSVSPLKKPHASGTRHQSEIAPPKSAPLRHSTRHNAQQIPIQHTASEITPSEAAGISSSTEPAVGVLSLAVRHCASPTSSGKSLPSISCRSPCGEVELQQRGRKHNSICFSSNVWQQEACTDPLLHWTECWAGPGLRRRLRAAQQQQQQQQAYQSSSELTQPADTLTSKPRTQQWQQSAVHGAAAWQAPFPDACQPSLSAGRPHATPVAPASVHNRNSRSRSTSSTPPPGPGGQQQQSQQQLPGQQQRCSLRWWLLGGVGLAAVSGCAVVAVYGVMTYVMKAAMAYSFAWKAATGVAAAEGLALGGWSVSSAQAGKALATAAAAELSCLRSQAGRELTALQVLLQQREAAYGQEVSDLSALNARLNHIAQKLKSENAGLQAALQQAAAERKALEAAAALESSRAETSAVVSVAAAHSGRVIDELLGLAAQQQQLVALVCDLREDVLGLVVGGEAGEGTGAAATAVLTAQLLDSGRASGKGLDSIKVPHSVEAPGPAGTERKKNAAASAAVCKSAVAAAAAPGEHGVSSGNDCPELRGHDAAPEYAAANHKPQRSSKASSSTATVTNSGESAAGTAAKPGGCGSRTAAKDISFLTPAPACSTSGLALLQLKSVRGGVDAALAATVADTLLT